MTSRPLLSFVPLSTPAPANHIEALASLVSAAAGRMLVMTGAGVSTESGVPDYRSQGVGLYARTGRRPMEYSEFLRSAEARRRYWARNYVAWPRFSGVLPNLTHNILAEWEKKGRLSWLVTQNVDALHSKAGNDRLVELHGCTHRVGCLSCSVQLSRVQLQDRMRAANPDWGEPGSPEQVAPDGDVLLTEHQVENFVVPECPNCGGALKPDIVFFGDNVPAKRRDHVMSAVDQAEALLCIGTSLQVYSGYRFVLRAKEQSKPVAIVTIGPTRADHLADVKVEGMASDVLKRVDNILSAS